jgi:hypothetical protein
VHPTYDYLQRKHATFFNMTCAQLSSRLLLQLISFLFFFQTKCYYVAQDGLKLATFLSQTPEWDCKQLITFISNAAFHTHLSRIYLIFEDSITISDCWNERNKNIIFSANIWEINFLKFCFIFYILQAFIHNMDVVIIKYTLWNIIFRSDWLVWQWSN